MARYWELLGFVARVEIQDQMPVYVEVERRLPVGGVNTNAALTDQDLQKALGADGKWRLDNGRLVPK